MKNAYKNFKFKKNFIKINYNIYQKIKNNLIKKLILIRNKFNC